MANEKLLTIVLPVRNRANIVGRTLESIAAQTCSDFNLIIVDNGSTDATAEKLLQWQRANCSAGFSIEIINEPRQGAAIARNSGLRRASTPYTMFFDSDDAMRPNHVRRIVDYLTQRPDTQLLRWDVAIIDPDGWSHVKNQRFHNELQLHLLHGTLSTQRFVASTELLNAVGGWDERLSTWDDLELGTRLIFAADSVRKLHGEPTVEIYPTDDSISGTSFSARATQRIQALEAIRQTIITHTTEGDDGSNRNILDARCAILAAMFRREGHGEFARQLYPAVLRDHSRRERLRLRTVYAIARILGRGASAAALSMLGAKHPRR